MSAFHFRLDRVLQLRRRAETDRARELGAALRREEAARTEKESAERALEGGHRAVTDPGALGRPMPAGVLASLRTATRALAHALDHAERRHDRSAAEVDAERQEFDEARRERRVLERLREQAADGWRVDAARRDQKNTDAIAEQRWRLREDG
jgi:flagellar export protein FliJ